MEAKIVKTIEYIRKDIVDNMLATAEDHAYFAGSESTREKLTDAFIDKACESYCKVCLTEGCEGGLKDCIWLNRFKEAMGGE